MIPIVIPQAVDRRGTFSTTIRTSKKEILSAQSLDPQRSFCSYYVLSGAQRRKRRGRDNAALMKFLSEL